MRRLDNIDIRLLRIFVALVDAQGFANAQITLNLSQSTLSTHLAALERKLGTSLCERGRRGFRLTEFGEATYEAAKRLFADIETFQARIGRDQGRLRGRLRVGIVDGVVTSPVLGLQTALARYCAYAPDVFIDLSMGTPSSLEAAAAEGLRDVVIGPMSQKIPGLKYLPIYREQQALYCGHTHPLFHVPDAEISQEAIDQTSFSVRGYLHFDDLYRANHPRPAATVMQMEAQLMMILSGRFIGFLPSHIGELWESRGQIRTLKKHKYNFTSSHFVVTRNVDEKRALIQSFIEEIKRQASPS